MKLELKPLNTIKEEFQKMKENSIKNKKGI